MSRVYILAADKELPLCDVQKPRASRAGGYAVTLHRGLKVESLHYYLHAVEELGYPMKPFRYDFHWKKRKKA